MEDLVFQRGEVGDWGSAIENQSQLILVACDQNKVMRVACVIHYIITWVQTHNVGPNPTKGAFFLEKIAVLVVLDCQPCFFNWVTLFQLQFKIHHVWVTHFSGSANNCRGSPL